MFAVVENSAGTVPAFLVKLWTLVEDSSTDHLIQWDPSGTSFHVYDQQSFSREILPMYFKHNNIASFIRQLNMYGFRKVAHIEQGGLKIEKDDLQFQHQYFQKGERDMLQFIKRKVSAQTVKSEALAPVHSDEMLRVLTDVNQVKSKQESLEHNLEYIKRENKLLWREVAALRQKHHKSQQIMNKLVQFLVSLVHSNRSGGLTIPPIRRMPLAISDVSQLAASPPPPPTVSPSVNRIQEAPSQTESIAKSEAQANVVVSDVDQSMVITNDDQYLVQSPPSGEMYLSTVQNSAGPIIRELTDSPQKAYLVPTSLLSPSSLASANNSIILGSDNKKYVIVPASDANTVALSSVRDSKPENFLMSPKIETPPTLQDAFNFGLNVPSASALVSAKGPAPLNTTVSSQKRKRKPSQSGTEQTVSPPKRLVMPVNAMVSSGLQTPQIPTVPCLDQLTRDSSALVKDLTKKDSTKNDLAVATSSKDSDDTISSDLQDFLTTDLDGLKNILQDQYKFDPSFLIDLFDTSNPWPLMTEKDGDSTKLHSDNGEAGTSGAGNGNITGTELVEYNPRDELFPELMEGTMMADIDDID